jgi:hypothetical protein
LVEEIIMSFSDAVVKNALILSAKILFNGVNSIVVLNFEYSDGTQKWGPFVVTDDLIAGILRAADAPSWEELPGKAVRVRASMKEVEEVGHIIRDIWINESGKDPRPFKMPEG